MTTLEFLERMLEATPVPPTDSDVDGLLAAFQAMVAERQVLLDQMSGLVVDAAYRAIANTVIARERVWRDALAVAQQLVKSQRVGATQLRAYASVG
ncbi:MAG: hypothetical protein ABI867_01150 [Kofleriaceae bacterium]